MTKNEKYGKITEKINKENILFHIIINSKKEWTDKILLMKEDDIKAEIKMLGYKITIKKITEEL